MMKTFRLSNALPAGLKAAGLDPAAVLRKAGLPLGLWSGGQAMVTTQQFFALWRAVEELNGDPALGHKLPGLVPIELHHPASIAAHHARTFRDALQRFARYKLLCCYEEVKFHEADGECSLEFNWILSRQAPPDLLLDTAFAAAIELGRRGTQKPLRARRVELRRGPANRKLHETFYGAPVTFNARRDAIVFRSADLDLPFASYNADLLAMLTPQLDAQLDRARREQSAADQVRWVLRRLLGASRPGIGDVARELGVSRRTLQRRITGEGTSFRQVLGETRRELAQYYLQEPSLSVSEIAYLLSYEDPSSFFRAFHEWEQATPKAWKSAHARRRPVAPLR
ncbi:MAG: AraC family transcriptional regulator, partial [Verrucomicrobiota bacterium]